MSGEQSSDTAPRPGRRWPWAVAAAVLALAATGFWLLRDTTTPVELEDVVADFRDTEVGDAPAGTPAPGVYAYTTSGSERIEMLGGLQHDYPALSPMIVTPESCGVRMTWAPLEERREEWLVCPDDTGAVRLRESVALHRFAGRADHRVSACDADALVQPADLTPGTTFRADCSSEATGLSGATTVAWRGEVVESTTADVGGQQIDVVHLRIELRNGGTTSGGGTVDRWVVPDTGLIVREVAEFETVSDTVLGDVERRESYRLELQRLTPYR